MNFNQVTLAGRLTRDIETRTTSGGTTVAKIGLAVNHIRTSKSTGEKHEETLFIDCTAFGAQAETLAKYVSKGDPLFVVGRMKLEQWEDKTSGEKRSKFGVIVERFQFIGGGQRRGEPATTGDDGLPF